jgi:UPF0042 nucleotide-binding protein
MSSNVQSTVSANTEPVRVAIVTGMSGAGRSTASWALDDLGWYVIDNLPTQLVPTAVDHLITKLGVHRVGMVVDVRAGRFFDEFAESVSRLRGAGHDVSVLFLDAADDVLVRRFEYTRRPHPLQQAGTLLAAVQNERSLMADVRSIADVVVDTGALTPHELRHRIGDLFSGGDAPLHLTIQSFGFKFGLPVDADIVFDFRFLPNPHWVPELKSQTGLQPSVANYVMSSTAAPVVLKQLVELLSTVLPGYLAEGKRFVSIAIGCTGGKHRSVAMTTALSSALTELGFVNQVNHRDIGRE